ncbi:MAG TPA: hypothetical protein PK413_12360 [Thermoanaerobaculia bacterium]|nr:hypothetical protein [Thermoanaerobaculia bacterium]
MSRILSVFAALLVVAALAVPAGAEPAPTPTLAPSSGPAASLTVALEADPLLVALLPINGACIRGCRASLRVCLFDCGQSPGCSDSCNEQYQFCAADCSATP